MRVYYIFAILLAVSGCASITQDVFDHVQKGDTREDVVNSLGKPAEFGPSSTPGAFVYVYRDGPESCQIRFKDNKVDDYQCQGQEENKARRKLSTALKTMGQSMQNAGGTTTNCQPNGFGGYRCNTQ